MAASLVIGAAHPHLFFEAGDVGALRTAAAGTHNEIASHLTSILSQHLGDPAPADPGSDGGTYIDGGTIGPIDSGPGDLEPDGGTAQPDAGFAVGPPPTSGSSFPHGGFGCSSGGAAMGLEVGVLLALAGLRRRRRG
ncbi:MAG TPA: MYXO-CTERM sorting domain-containing protein [Myxococcales bacterium]